MNNQLKTTLLRVPEVTLLFWIAKTLSTTVGETGADFLAFDLNLGMPLVALIMSTIMAIFLFFQFTKIKAYSPTVYWSIVVLMSVIGTLITDILVDDFGVSLELLTIVFTLSMLVGFAVWYKNEKTLSIHSIDTAKREAYYWLVILLAFALGTGVGDLLSERFALGYATALTIFGGAIVLTAIGYYKFKLNAVFAFWVVYVLTRPLGASLGDLLIQPVNEGGMGLSMVYVNLLFLATIVSIVFYMSVRLRKLEA
ncbi:MAG TPA: hypothetical protein ENK73_07155 [Thiomicrospira sp.]|jgi:uncharacterized membrane-anchored protein|nr:hypothetical protein [Thiomicrospira sp.]